MGLWASYVKLQEFEREKKHVCVVFLSPFEPRDSSAAELRRAANQRWCCNQSRTRTRQLSSQIRWWNGGNYRRLPFQITRFNYVKTHQLVRTKLRNKTGRLGQYYILFLQNTSQKSLLKNSLMERRKSQGKWVGGQVIWNCKNSRERRSMCAWFSSRHSNLEIRTLRNWGEQPISGGAATNQEQELDSCLAK